MKARQIVNKLLEDCGECEGDLDVDRYMAMIKAHPQLRRFSREELRRYLATRPPAQPEPPSEPHQIVGEAEEPLDIRGRFMQLLDYVQKHPEQVTKHIRHIVYNWSPRVVTGSVSDRQLLELFTWIYELPDSDRSQQVMVLVNPGPFEEDFGIDSFAEAEELPPEEPLDPRAEIDRLLPTKTYTLGGNTMIHAPGVIRMAQHEWQIGRKKQKTWAMNLLKSWEGLPEEVYLAILNGKVEIETQGDNAVITVKQY